MLSSSFDTALRCASLAVARASRRPASRPQHGQSHPDPPPTLPSPRHACLARLGTVTARLQRIAAALVAAAARQHAPTLPVPRRYRSETRRRCHALLCGPARRVRAPPRARVSRSRLIAHSRPAGGSSPSRAEAARPWSGDSCGDSCASRVFAAAWRDDTRTLASGLACRSVRDGHYGHLCLRLLFLCTHVSVIA